MVTWVLQEPGWKTVDRFLSGHAFGVVLPGLALTETINKAREKGNRATPREILEASIDHPGPRGEYDNTIWPRCDAWVLG